MSLACYLTIYISFSMLQTPYVTSHLLVNTLSMFVRIVLASLRALKSKILFTCWLTNLKTDMETNRQLIQPLEHKTSGLFNRIPVTLYCCKRLFSNPYNKLCISDCILFRWFHTKETMVSLSFGSLHIGPKYDIAGCQTLSAFYVPEFQECYLSLDHNGHFI